MPRLGGLASDITGFCVLAQQIADRAGLAASDIKWMTLGHRRPQRSFDAYLDAVVHANGALNASSATTERESGGGRPNARLRDAEMTR